MSLNHFCNTNWEITWVGARGSWIGCSIPFLSILKPTQAGATTYLNYFIVHIVSHHSRSITTWMSQAHQFQFLHNHFPTIISIIFYHMFYYINVQESMGKSCGCIKSLYYKSFMNPYQYYKSCENLCQVLQVLCAASEHVIKLKVCMKSLLT